MTALFFNTNLPDWRNRLGADFFFLVAFYRDGVL